MTEMSSTRFARECPGAFRVTHYGFKAMCDPSQGDNGLRGDDDSDAPIGRKYAYVTDLARGSASLPGRKP
jgi:hypothetical protein